MPTKTVHRAVNPTKQKVIAGLDIVAIHEIAERLNVPRVTVEKWRVRSKAYAGKLDEDGTSWAFPEPRWSVANGRTGLWLFDQDIMPWIIATGREHYLEGRDRADED